MSLCNKIKRKKKAYPKLITDCKESNHELARQNDIKTVCQIYEESPSSW